MKTKVMAAVGVVGFLVSAGVAFAQTADSAQPMRLDISPTGKVALMRGTIDAVSGSSLTVKTWGGDWTVNVGSSTEVLPQAAGLSGFKTGDYVGVQGTVSQSASWTVDATIVRDWTARQTLTQEVKANVQAVRQAEAGVARVIQGSLSNLDASAQTFTLTNAEGKTFSVSLASGAKLLAKNWTTLDMSKVNSGDTVRVFGTVASSTVSASIFRDISVK